MTITRFAPSPTGLLHIGNIRTALVNYLYTRKKNGKFMLRMDDTDVVRSKEEYASGIIEDLKWMGFEWEIFAKQSERTNRYEEVKNQLLKDGRLYPCYEPQEEIEIKRKMQLSRGVPPIYDRSALKLTDEQKEQFAVEGRKPHYRFLLKDAPIIWDDEIRGSTKFEGKNLSDPVLIREDGTMTYILSSVIDDIDYKITNIIRGEDHVTNTAIQIQIFDCLNAAPPTFAHLALLKTKDSEMSKRTGGFDIRSLKDNGIESITIASLIAKIGTSMPIEPRISLDELINEFDIKKFSRAPANYDVQDLERLNHKVIADLPFAQVINKLSNKEIDENFWNLVRSNINKISEVEDWWQICKKQVTPIIDDKELMVHAIATFPESALNENSWNEWTKILSEKSGKKGKMLFMPLRKALTAMEHGPELKSMLPLIGRDKIIKRLNGELA
jgi:glutamyl-tRNA synthetase